MVKVLEKEEIAVKIDELDAEYDKALDAKDIEKAGNLTLDSIDESISQAKAVISGIKGFFEGENPGDLPLDELLLIHLEDAIPVVHWAYYSLQKFAIFRACVGGNVDINSPRSVSNDELKDVVTSTIKSAGLNQGYEKQVESIAETIVTLNDLFDSFVVEFGKIEKSGSVTEVDRLLGNISATMPECLLALRTAYIYFHFAPSIAAGMSKDD